MNWPHDGPPVPGPGPAFIARIGALVEHPRVHRVRWRWMLDWWDRYRKFPTGTPWRRGARRRGTPVS